MTDLNTPIQPEELRDKIAHMWDVSGAKILSIEKSADRSKGAPVYTVDGTYTARGWTDWTEGFQYGSAILQFDATGDREYLEIGRRNTVAHMAAHVTHFGVHDHGFNNVSTYGNLLRLLLEGRIDGSDWERNFYQLALKCSGAVQAARWTPLSDGGFVHSFNGAHSLFADTMRSMRVLVAAHVLGHELKGEQDESVSLLHRTVQHMQTTARYTVYYGEGRDGYDVAGRVAHESIFNTASGAYRCPSTQQGYSPFTTWTRAAAWIICGYAEELEYFLDLDFSSLEQMGGRDNIVDMMLRAARVSADYFIEESGSCGVPYWDTGAPGLRDLGDWKSRPADPFNDFEPVDSSAAAIAAQGFLRLSRVEARLGNAERSSRYATAGLRTLDTLLSEPYLSSDPGHQGLLLHAEYHWPNRWDHVPDGHKVACGEATMWGDYHLREACLYVQRILNNQPYLAFYKIADAG